jgi:hypothetical protein
MWLPTFGTNLPSPYSGEEMEIAGSSKTLIIIFEITQSHNPEDHRLTDKPF